MGKSKWVFKAHSYQIADTGDYDGYYEITNGDITLITKDDLEETERQLKLVVAVLNRWGINFIDQKAEDLAIDIHCMKDAQKWKDEEFATLRARADRMEQALREITRTSQVVGQPGCTWCDTDLDSVAVAAGYNQCLENILIVVNKALEQQPAEPTIPQQGAETPEWVTRLSDQSPTIPDLTEATSEEKELLINTLFKSCGMQFMKIFYAIGLKTHMETGIVNESNGDLFRLQFKLMQKGVKERDEQK